MRNANVSGGRASASGSRAKSSGGRPNASGSRAKSSGGRPNASGGRPKASGGRASASGNRANASGSRPSLTGHSGNRTGISDKASRARTFGETLRKARLERGSSQEDLSRLSGVDRSAISNYERGLREPNLRSIVRLARALKMDPAALLRDL